jgi:hypothetical protein
VLAGVGGGTPAAPAHLYGIMHELLDAGIAKLVTPYDTLLRRIEQRAGVAGASVRDGAVEIQETKRR